MAKRKWTYDEIKEYREVHGSFIYFNKEDSNIMVPKASGMGSTLNWANPISWLVILALILFIIFIKMKR